MWIGALGLGALSVHAKRRARPKPAPITAEPEQPTDANAYAGIPSAFAPGQKLTWQQERALESNVRQDLVNLYLTLLGAPNLYRGEYATPLPNRAPDWQQLPDGTKRALSARQDGVNAKTRGRTLGYWHLERLARTSHNFRPTDLRVYMADLPRLTDVKVTVSRVQPLGDGHFLVDFDVDTGSSSGHAHTRFAGVECIAQNGQLTVPSRVLTTLHVASPAFAGLADGAGLLRDLLPAELGRILDTAGFAL